MSRKGRSWQGNLYPCRFLDPSNWKKSLEIAGQMVLLNHMPYAVHKIPNPMISSTEKEFRPRNEGHWLLQAMSMKNGKLKIE